MAERVIDESKRRLGGMPYTSTITFGTDKDGNRFSAANNPKRGTASRRFALYEEGMTIREALDAGVKPTDINWDRKKGYIRITAP